MNHPQEDKKTLAICLSDEPPYETKQEITLDFKTYRATVSIERRSLQAQNNKRFIILGLISYNGTNHKLAKLNFEGTTCTDNVIYTLHVIQKQLLSLHTMSDDLIIALYQYYVCLYDQNLDCKKQIAWIEELPVSVLTNFGIAPNNVEC